jgi:hypothetical protein
VFSKVEILVISGLQVTDVVSARVEASGYNCNWILSRLLYLCEARTLQTRLGGKMRFSKVSKEERRSGFS